MCTWYLINLSNSADKLRHPRSYASAKQVLLNKQQIWGGKAVTFIYDVFLDIRICLFQKFAYYLIIIIIIIIITTTTIPISSITVIIMIILLIFGSGEFQLQVQFPLKKVGCCVRGLPCSNFYN